jgi:hypothetical protein
MTAVDTDLRTVIARLEVLEKKYQRLKRAWAIVLALIVVGLSISTSPAAPTQAAPSGDTIETQRIVLMDKDGKPHGEIAANGGLPRVVLYDEKEHNKIFISPYFVELDTPLRTISFDPSGVAIEMKGYGRMALDYDKMSFTDPKRKLRMALFPNSISFYYQNSMPAANLAVGESGPSLQLEDIQGQSAILGGATVIAGEPNQRSAASLVLLDGQGKAIWKAPE